MANENREKKVNSKAEARRNKKIEEKRARISERAAESKAGGFDVPASSSTSSRKS